jgi:Putative bacterial sensory transduction regulator
MRAIHFTALAVSLLSSTLADAQDSACGKDLICAADPQSVVAALQDGGYRAELSSDEAGPYIVSAASGYRFVIFFNDCTMVRDCKSLQFNLRLSAKDHHTAPYANGYNRRFRFAQLSAQSNNELRLSYDINTVGGKTKSNFSAILGDWAGSIGAYVNYDREKPFVPAPAAPPAPPKYPDPAKAKEPK